MAETAVAEPPKGKEKSPEEVDKQLQEDARKSSEERKKFIDGVMEKIQTELDKGVDRFGGLREMVKEIADRVLKTQVVASGARYGPTPMELDELNKRDFPFIIEPLPDGIPVANIDQATKREDKEKKPATPSAAKK